VTYRHGGQHNARLLNVLDARVSAMWPVVAIWQAFAANDR
jgi:hypothetical protein